MTRCPSCGAQVPAGETICLECGTELVVGNSADLDAEATLTGDEAEPPPKPEPSPSEVTPGRTCPDCGEFVQSDANGLCPVCGHDFGAAIEIDEEEFFREPLPLEEQMKKRLRQFEDRERAYDPDLSHGSERDRDGPSRSPRSLPGDRMRPDERAEDDPYGYGPRSQREPYGEPASYDEADMAGPRGRRGRPPGGEPRPRRQDPRRPRPAAPLPGDRHRTRYRGDDGGRAHAEHAPILMVEGGQSVFFDGRMTERIRLDVDQLSIGRRDPGQGHYPDVDLAHLRHIDGHISRRHARILRRGGQWVIEDLADNDATFLNDRSHVLNLERAVLQDGDRILISDALAMVFRSGGGDRR